MGQKIDDLTGQGGGGTSCFIGGTQLRGSAISGGQKRLKESCFLGHEHAPPLLPLLKRERERERANCYPASQIWEMEKATNSKKAENVFT